jgi:hypothetical protein
MRNGVIAFDYHGYSSVPAEWISRLNGHADLIQKLVQGVPKALARPSLTLEQGERLHAVIEKGAHDFDELLQIMDQRTSMNNIAKLRKT